MMQYSRIQAKIFFAIIVETQKDCKYLLIHK